MMKKYKNKGLCLCILMLIALLIIPNNVEAKKKSSSNDDNSAADNACSSTFFNGDMLSGSQDGNNYYVKVSAKEGLWNVKYYYGEVDEFDYSNVESSTPTGTFTYKGGSDQTITIPKLADSQLRLVVIAELQGDTTKKPPQGYDKDGKILKVSYKDGDKTKKTTCRPGTVELNSKSNFNITGTGAVITKVIKAKSSKQSRALSAEEQIECDAMIQAKYKTSDVTSYLSETQIAGYNAQMKVSFPYCYGASYAASYDITAKTIKKIRQSSLKAYKAYAEFSETAANNAEYEAAVKEIEAEGYKLLEYNPNGIRPKGMLSCTKDQVTEKTEKYYTRHTEVDGTKDGNACNVVCQEQIQVTYDPPVATKAGLCFQYKVTVKSKVTCKVDLTTQPKWPTPPSSCSYSPICSGNEQETQAGPSEKFDSCVKSCDGGKYTQSCINSCYKKVYKNNESSIKKTATTDITPKVEKLAKSSKDPYYSNKNCNTNAKIQASIASDGNYETNECVNFFYKVKQKYPMGYYKKASSNSPKWMDYEWQPCWKSSNSNCSITDDNDKEISYTIDKTTGSTSVENMVEAIKRSSPYYFRNKKITLKNIQALYGKANGVNGYGTPRKYNIDDGGIKRQVTVTHQCPEVCGFVQDDDNASDCKKSDSEVRKYYVDAFDKITSQLEKCTASAACKEDTAEFQINADNEVMKDQDTKNKSSFAAQNKTNSDSKTCYNPSGNIEMFIPLVTDLESGAENSECNINPNGINGKCYGKNNPTYWQHYKTTITYPGTWINLKTAARSYTKDGLDLNTVREKKNYYCTGYDFEPVNRVWWNWKINLQEDMSKIDNVTIEKDDNITAKIVKFGKYNWSFDLKCFYALSNETCLDGNCDSDTTTKKKESCDDENSTELCNIDFRPVSISNLFPDKDGTSSRAAGFNWTSAAKDNTITDDTAGYGIDPGKYAEKIQSEAAGNDEANYSGSADYTVHLTKANIKSLREYAKKNGYTLYEGNNKNPVTGVEGLYYYKSNLLGDNTYTTNFSRNVSLGINNN